MLVDEQGPVIIDLPQVVDAAANNQARAMLERDVNNMRNYYGMYAPSCSRPATPGRCGPCMKMAN